MRLLAGLCLVLPVFAGCASPASEPGPAFQAEHWDSRPHDDGFVEVFRVTRVTEQVPVANLSFQLDGDEIQVDWEQEADGRVSEGDAFSFVADAFDRERVLVASLEGDEVWRVSYRGGTGTPVEDG